MCACMYARAHIFTRVYTSIYVNVRMCMCIYAYTRVFMNVCVYLCRFVCPRMCARMYACVQIFTRVIMYLQMYTCMYACVCQYAQFVPVHDYVHYVYIHISMCTCTCACVCVRRLRTNMLYAYHWCIIMSLSKVRGAVNIFSASYRCKIRCQDLQYFCV